MGQGRAAEQGWRRRDEGSQDRELWAATRCLVCVLEFILS